MTSILQNKYVRGLISFIFWIGLWQILCISINQSILLPSPMQTLSTFLKLLLDKSFYLSIFTSLSKIFIGLLLGTALGCALGLLCHFRSEERRVGKEC